MCKCLARLASIYNGLCFMLLHFGSRAKVVYYAWCFICVKIRLLVRCVASFVLTLSLFLSFSILLLQKCTLFIYLLLPFISFHHSCICFGSFVCCMGALLFVCCLALCSTSSYICISLFRVILRNSNPVWCGKR